MDTENRKSGTDAAQRRQDDVTAKDKKILALKVELKEAKEQIEGLNKTIEDKQKEINKLTADLKAANDLGE